MDRADEGGDRGSAGANNGWWLSNHGEQIAGMRGHAIFAMDSEGFITSWNDHAEKVNGFPGDEVIGRHCSVLYPADQAEQRRPEWQLDQAARAGFYMDQGWRRKKDDSRFWASIAITVQRSNDGSLDGFIAMIRDETEARARHQRSTRRFTDLFDLAPVGIALFDESDRVLHANTALCELLGYRLEELHGVSGVQLLHPQDQEDTAEGLVPATVGSTSSPDEAPASERVLARADGEPVVCSLHSAMSMEDSGLRFWQVVFQDVTEQRRRTALLQHRATHDELTGLLNRSGIYEHLDSLLRESAPNQVAVLLCDLDHFKRVNDSLGHEAGDELLEKLARRLTSGLPEVCTAGRLFGDEFLVICSDLSAVGDLDALAESVSRLMHVSLPVQGYSVSMSASIGAAVAESSDTTSQDLVRFSDAAMYSAKTRASVGVTVANREMIDTSSRQVQIEAQLHEAINNDELTLQYQPILEPDGSVAGAEALLRWSHPDLGMVAPDVILPVATQGNLLRELDRSVLRTALREAASWPSVRGRRVQIAVNLSGLLPDDPHFTEETSRLVTESGIDWSSVVLELVETSLSELSARSREDMVSLAEGGAQFAIDDFGTAYSSLRRLKELPVQLIKIDRGFVSSVDKNPADLAIVRAIVDMSSGLKCYCVAEGVETETQFRVLHSLGVDLFQGFLFSRPLSAPDFHSLLETGHIPIPES
ncbi:putative bifunctional diguanylate cyclase/phosphodiesterase [Actinopolyspora saharensis]|uniref:putative bifunctional diguanylate cyclase/phosphodiesterase n=1 Tax=Actinopolyspora saharensis TaxID=995062 RepID=UPI003F66ADD8